MGHVKDLPKSQLGIDIESNFEHKKTLPYEEKGPLLNNLRKEAAKADNVLLATDPDREGEAISWHLASTLGLPRTNPVGSSFMKLQKMQC